MDDLDALLADLQTTSKNISNFDHQPQSAQQTHYATPNKSHQTHQQQTIMDMRNASESPPPPPLPPPPAQDVLDSLNGTDAQQPLYEPQQVVQSSGAHRVNTSYSQQPQSPSPEYSQISPDYRQLSPTSPLPKPDPTMTSTGSPKKKTPPPVPAKPAMSASRTGHQSPPPPTQTGGPNGVQSSLSSNLSELDILLQDLNSAQFMAEMDKRNSAGSQQQISPKSSSTPVKPGAEERARVIDSFVEDLKESDVPSPGYSTIADYPSPVTGHYHVVNGPASSSIGQQPAASSATKELDDLMASLSNFKVNVTAGASGEPAYAKPNKPASGSSPQGTSQSKGQTQLDAMLGNLQSDMSKQGVNTTAKGHCAACQKPIVGQVITALGKIWHPEHFTCDECHGELGTKNFFERDGKPYCERDYHNLFSPKCAYCNGPVLDKCVTALDRTWHPEHFFCAQCGRTFGDDGFHEKDGKAYCREDYFEMFAPKCGGCSRPIMDNYISALNKQWHPECFVCRDCHVAFNGGSFFDHEGLPYCETHYHAKRGSLCAGCQKPITGRCITAMYKKFHPEHFVCAFCLKQLNKGTFKEQNDKPYCHSCFVKLFG